MIPLPQRPLSSAHAAIRSGGAVAGPGAASAAHRVTVSPSRAEVRRADPSLSFQVVAPGARSFDVIVATDPALFDPTNAHRRTPKNFRSSRQDFQGAPIEIETGFYLLPRAFLRDMVSVVPRPTRLYYVAVAYADAEARQGRYSVPPEAMATAAPHVTIAADLVAANLSKVHGVAVERLGAVNAAGQVMASEPRPRALPDVIGGLPVIRRAAPPPPPSWHGTNGGNGAAGGNGAPAGNGGRAGAGGGNGANAGVANGSAAGSGASGAPGGNGLGARNGGHGTAANGRNGGTVGNGAPAANGGNAARAANGGAGAAHHTGPSQPPEPAGAPPPAGGGFVDEDYAFGGGSDRQEAPRFRDLDSGKTAAFAYDDGYGAPAAAFTEDGGEPIPELDPAPEPAAAPDPAATAPHAPTPAPSGAAGEDLLLQAVIAEGAGGRYDALSLDGGFRGRFGTSDPYYQRAHDGLRVGPHQAVQDNGELGELLALMREADGAAFAQTFGPDADTLIAVTTAEGPSGLDSPGGRGPRVQPVAGRDLWEEPWVERFRAAARHPPFQAAMRAQILARRLDPLRPVAEALGIDGDRGLAMLLSLAIHRGVEGAVAHAGAAVNPFDTPARLGAALDALGYADLVLFRQAQGLPPGDTLDGPTHFALLAALRALGPDSPVQVLDAEGVMDALVTAAGPGPVGDALLRLRVSAAFGDPAAGG